MVLLWLEKVKWDNFFCKKGISYTNCLWKSKKLHIKPAKTLQKRCFYRNFHLNSANGPGPFAEFCKRSRSRDRLQSVNGPGTGPFIEFCKRSRTVCRNPQKLVGGLEKPLFLKVFCPLCVLFFAFSSIVCIWNGYLKKKSDLGCFFWPQGPLIEKSAAPQGSPPPTQQINIRSTNQLSWAIIIYSNHHNLQ